MIAGLVLAAGTSTRLGTPKQLLDLGGKPLLQYVLDAAGGSRLGDIVVVLGHEAAAVGAAVTLPARARTLVNEDFAQGQAGSLRTGLVDLGEGPKAAAILLGDQPEVDAALIDRVLDAFEAQPTAVLRPSFRGTPGHPVVVARSHWPGWMGLTGDAGARDWMRSHPDEIKEIAIDAEPPADVDTWEAYERLRTAF